MTDAFFAWSGGKDSALGLYRILKQQQYRVKYLLTTVNEAHQRISMHGVRISIAGATGASHWYSIKNSVGTRKLRAWPSTKSEWRKQCFPLKPKELQRVFSAIFSWPIYETTAKIN